MKSLAFIYSRDIVIVGRGVNLNTGFIKGGVSWKFKLTMIFEKTNLTTAGHPMGVFFFGILSNKYQVDEKSIVFQV